MGHPNNSMHKYEHEEKGFGMETDIDNVSHSFRLIYAGQPPFMTRRGMVVKRDRGKRGALTDCRVRDFHRFVVRGNTCKHPPPLFNSDCLRGGGGPNVGRGSMRKN